ARKAFRERSAGEATLSKLLAGTLDERWPPGRYTPVRLLWNRVGTFQVNWLPGWDSVARTAFLHSFFEYGGIVFLALLVVFELLAAFYGHRHDVLLDAAAHDETIRRDLAEDNLRGQIAQANREA